MLPTAIFRKTAANRAFRECGLIVPILQGAGSNPAGRNRQQTVPFGAACCFLLKRNGLSRIIERDPGRKNGIGSVRP